MAKELARDRVLRADLGDDRVARIILKEARVALTGVVRGDKPGPERLVYLEYVRDALCLIVDGAPADKALGVYTTNRPKSLGPDRDFKIFCAVGKALNDLEQGGKGTVALARKNVTTNYDFGSATVKKAWERYGGRKVWRELDVDTSRSQSLGKIIDSMRSAIRKQRDSLRPGDRNRQKLDVLLKYQSRKKRRN